ncbi:MAG: endonuclease III domain-containing protein [Promethearchaeota archaeon]
MIFEVYTPLKEHYTKLDPHAETWDLWIKGNKSSLEVYEVAIGTILVQNTNWSNVNKAIENLKNTDITSFKKLQKIPLETLEELIKPAGFYTQKASYLKSLSNLFLIHSDTNTSPSRGELLKCKGIGKETADSILVYCFQQPIPIIGTYTRRFLARIQGNADFLRIKYENLQKVLIEELKEDSEILGRFHALVVVHGQNYCQKNNPLCPECFLLDLCTYGQKHETDSNIAQIQKQITKSLKRKKK